MSNRTGSVFVGAFVVGALVIAVAGALFIGSGGIGVKRTPIVMVFEESLRGLNVGAPVALRGVTVGQVTDIDVQLNTEAGNLTMVVRAEIDPSTMQVMGSVNADIAAELVARGLVAQLELQSLLTGLLYVQLDFRPTAEARTRELALTETQIPTIPTQLEQLRSSLEKIDYQAITESLDRIASGLDTLLNNENMQALPETLRRTLESVASTSDELNTTLAGNGDRLTTLLDNSNDTVSLLGERLPALVESIDGTVRKLDSALASAESSLASLDRATAPDSPPRQQLSATLQELSLAARALRSLAYSLEEHPESLLRGRQPEGDK